MECRYNEKTKQFELSNDGKKAIRFCCGFSTDLRQKIDISYHVEFIYEFIYKNFYSITGALFLDFDLNQIEEKKEVFCKNLTQQVTNC